MLSESPSPNFDSDKSLGRDIRRERESHIKGTDGGRKSERDDHRVKRVYKYLPIPAAKTADKNK